MEVTTCPVLAFTPEVDEMLRLFQYTHEPQAFGMGGMRWHRIALPRAGGVGDQDARTMQALQVVRDEMNAIASASAAGDQAGDELASFRNAHGRNGQ